MVWSSPAPRSTPPTTTLRRAATPMPGTTSSSSRRFSATSTCPWSPRSRLPRTVCANGTVCQRLQFFLFLHSSFDTDQSRTVAELASSSVMRSFFKGIVNGQLIRTCEKISPSGLILWFIRRGGRLKRASVNASKLCLNAFIERFIHAYKFMH